MDKYEFKLSQKQVEYLRQLALRDELLPRMLNLPGAGQGAGVSICLSRAEARQLREFLTTHLALVGFREDYEPNEQGQILEDLIDKFFIP